MGKLNVALAFIVVLALYSILGELWHAKNTKKVAVVIEMQKITGEWIQVEYSLPYDYLLQINSHRGSYNLQYIQTDCPIFTGTHWKTIRSGVIDFKVFKTNY